MYNLQEEEEYEDEEEEEIDEPEKPKHGIDAKFKDALEEEDPEVIKELIALIKKVGGLDELEKQLQIRLSLNENSPILNNNHRTTTTMSPISQSLYDKVLSTKRGNSNHRQEFGSGRVSSEKAIETETEPLVQRQHKENRYSSVVRNSRPRPQNDGIENLSELDGSSIIRERPQYVTITRTHPPRTTSIDTDEEDTDDNQSKEVNDNQSKYDEDEPSRSTSTTTHQPQHQYVNIRRSRPTTTTTESNAEISQSSYSQEAIDDGVEEENNDNASDKHATTRMQYVSIQRTRPTRVQTAQVDESETTPESK